MKVLGTIKEADIPKILGVKSMEECHFFLGNKYGEFYVANPKFRDKTNSKSEFIVACLIANEMSKFWDEHIDKDLDYIPGIDICNPEEMCGRIERIIEKPIPTGTPLSEAIKMLK